MKRILDGMEMKFRIFDCTHRTTWIAGMDQHDTFNIWEDNQVSYYNYQTGEASLLSGEEMPDDGSGYILMRYTGKHDAEGNEVYEGDIIENPDGVQMEIRYGVYQGYCPADRCFVDSVGFYAVGEGLPEMPIGFLEDYAVVVGNVWENPELKVGGPRGESNQI